MSEKDDIFPGHPSGGSDHSTRDQAESADVASLQNELNEQQRLDDEMMDPFAANRVPTPGSGDDQGGRVRINRDHWGE